MAFVIKLLQNGCNHCKQRREEEIEEESGSEEDEDEDEEEEDEDEEVYHAFDAQAYALRYLPFAQECLQ